MHTLTVLAGFAGLISVSLAVTRRPVRTSVPFDELPVEAQRRLICAVLERDDEAAS
jgi:hypothetical protein